jgi:divalent metal cation (Fe/Co/Zn/Cd) transporter
MGTPKRNDRLGFYLGYFNLLSFAFRFSGDRVFVEFDLELDGYLTIDEGHAVGDAVEASVERLFPSTVEVTAHLEPAGIDDETLTTG